jgi:YfiR/HmsC-like
LALLITRRFALAAALLPWSGHCSGQAGGGGLEYQVKAAFLFNFLKFVEWPQAAGATPWVIGILGHDPFGELLDQTVKGKIVSGRPVEIRRYSRLNEVKDCNILFIGAADFGRIVIPAQPGLLTVGEAPGFLKSGGIINFYIEDNRVHFEIQPGVARTAGLRVSSQLLKLGRPL